ncbi:metallophosphoesterase [Thalassoglobus sp. JC818]|uniref:metallophosphoesterase n=1 Tax=Thalassoglobus sp. JC818 TaxID=3232136 RepID=UPI00345894D3
MSVEEWNGALFIGDPHLESRQPGFRKDNYPEVILEKLRWSLNYARENKLIPVLLGDLFDKPRDNSNWLLNQLFQLLSGEILTVYGNHDVHYQPELTDDDSLSLLVNSGHLTLISEDEPWVGTVAGRPLVIAGSSYRQKIPKTFDSSPHCGKTKTNQNPVVVWVTHHDILIPGYDEGRVKPRSIDGVDLIINGHIHRNLETVVKGKTSWITPGNISRRSRSDACRDHVPSVLELRLDDAEYHLERIEIPHKPFEEVFHEAVIEAVGNETQSAFVSGLAELQARRTDDGAGLIEFLESNVQQFSPQVAAEIMDLAKTVTEGDE